MQIERSHLTFYLAKVYLIQTIHFNLWYRFPKKRIYFLNSPIMSLTLTMLISIYSRKGSRVQMRIFFWISFKNSSNIFLDVFFSQFTFSSILALSKVFFFCCCSCCCHICIKPLRVYNFFNTRHWPINQSIFLNGRTSSTGFILRHFCKFV